jgi:hypothetical protein
LKPKTFSWTGDDSGECVVVADTGIIGSLGKLSSTDPRGKYAWIVESPEVVQHVVKYVYSNKKSLSYRFDAVFTCIEGLVGLEPNFYYCPSGSNMPWVKDHQIFNKSKLCSMFASTKRYTTGHSYRDVIAKALKGKTGFDLFGGTLNSPRIGGNVVHPDKADGLNDYMFSVVIENCKENNYYTEKLTDCFATGTIPIYWGSERVWTEYDSNGIIRLDDNFNYDMLTPNFYQSKIEAVKYNFEKVKKLEMADDVLYSKIKEIEYKKKGL